MITGCMGSGGSCILQLEAREAMAGKQHSGTCCEPDGEDRAKGPIKLCTGDELAGVHTKQCVTGNETGPRRMDIDHSRWISC